MQQNPLLDQPHLLSFDRIEPAHITPAVEVLLEQAKQALKAATLEEMPADWDHVVEPLERAVGRLGRAWGAVGHLTGVMDSPELREAYNANLPIVTQFYIELSQNEALFAKYKAIEADPAFETLDAVKQRVIRHEIRDFRLSGADLPEEKKARIKTLGERSAALSQKFSENLLDATNAFSLDIEDESRLDGIPEDVRQLYAAQAQAADVSGWRITLQYPSYIPVMQYANDRGLREELYRAFVTRASEFGPAERDNTPLIDETLAIRDEMAGLLGFDNYAEVSLATKMAESPATVIAFLRDLATRSKPWAKKDQAELAEFARTELGIDELKPWDQAWASEKLRQARYSYSDQEVKQYFALPAVFDGMFKLVENMFDISITPDTAPVWHPDVRFFKICDAQGRLIAQFYTDLYARQSKRGGAWMDSDQTRSFNPDGSERTPTAYLVCNFTQPVGDKPSLLTHDDVTTLFHEFGHGLHHMLSRITVSQLSGINGVEWDAVELPSQFMENWAWQYEIIRTISRHAETGEVLPQSLFDKMYAAKNFQSGLFSVRQLEFALFDMLIHSTYRDGGKDFMAVLRDVRHEVAVVPTVEYNRFAQSFGHIFAGGYAAGYYSYKWAEVLSADVFAAFEEEGMFNPDVGRRWLDCILSMGGSRDAMDNFKAFRGREPKIDALLRHTGMQGDPA